MDTIQAKELIDALEPLIFIDAFLAIIFALFLYDLTGYLIRKLTDYLENRFFPLSNRAGRKHD